MATEKQRRAARKNIKKAARAAKRKQTLKNFRKRPALLLANKQRRSPGRADEGAANGFFFHARSFSHERLE